LWKIISKNKFRLLNQAMNKMASNLEQQLSVVEAEKNQLATILAGMVEGVLVTDTKEIITLVNPAFSEMLALQTDCIGKSVLKCIRSRPLYESIQTALATGKPQEKTFSLQVGQEERHFMLHTTPLIGTLGPKGSVSVFYDVTDLRKLENIRRDFVANVSHELKTPLTNILGYAETLRMGAIDDKSTAARFVEKIENNALQFYLFSVFYDKKSDYYNKSDERSNVYVNHSNRMKTSLKKAFCFIRLS